MNNIKKKFHFQNPHIYESATLSEDIVGLCFRKLYICIFAKYQHRYCILLVHMGVDFAVNLYK